MSRHRLVIRDVPDRVPDLPASEPAAPHVRVVRRSLTRVTVTHRLRPLAGGDHVEAAECLGEPVDRVVVGLGHDDSRALIARAIAPSAYRCRTPVVVRSSLPVSSRASTSYVPTDSGSPSPATR